MRHAIQVLDALTIAFAFLPLLLMRRKWMTWSTIIASSCFAIVWYLHAWHPDWLGGLPPTLVDLSTFGLALLGGLVSILPPRKDQVLLKYSYIAGFITLALFGISANVWQRNIEKAKQDSLEAARTHAEIRFSADLLDVKNSSNAILNFVAHPPAGMSTNQVASIFQRFLAERQFGTAVTPTSLYEGLTDDELCLITKSISGEINDLMGAWKNEIRAEIEPRRNEIYEHSPPLETAEREKQEDFYSKQTDTANLTYTSQAKEIFVRAEALREVLVKRLALKNSVPRPVDISINDAFKKLAANGPGGYNDSDSFKVSKHLLELCKRLK